MNNVISLSGGKDSTAMLLMMLERKEPIHSVVFFDTGWEFPEMYKHLDSLEKYTGLKIVRLYPKISFDKTILKRSWPQMWFRWCSGEKRDALAVYHGKHKQYSACIGIAINEKKRLTRSIKVHKNCVYRFPLAEWGVSEKDALAYCYKHGFDWGGLYNHFTRVSCYCCPLKSLGDCQKIRKHYPELWLKMLSLDKLIKNNRGFKRYKTVYDLEKRFAEEGRQLRLKLKW